jgi:hypothetical protein
VNRPGNGQGALRPGLNPGISLKSAAHRALLPAASPPAHTKSFAEAHSDDSTPRSPASFPRGARTCELMPGGAGSLTSRAKSHPLVSGLPGERLHARVSDPDGGGPRAGTRFLAAAGCRSGRWARR